MLPYIEFKIDKVRKFRLAHLAQKRIEDKFKCPFTRIDVPNLCIDDMTYVLWACLPQSDREEFTPASFLELLDTHVELKDTYGLIREIFENAFGKNEVPPSVEDEQEAENGIGMTQYETL